MRTVVAALLALCATASADGDLPARLPTIDDAFPPTIRVETAAYAGRVLRLAIDPQPGVSWISFDIADRHAARAIIRVDVPAGTRIVGMSVNAHDVRSWSTLRRRRDAADRVRDAFDSFAIDDNDTALLAWDGTSADEDHVHLDVNANARVELAVLLPALPSVALAPTAPLIETPRGQVRLARSPVVVALPPSTAPAEYPHVTADLSLVTGAPDRPDARAPIERRFAAAPHGGGKKGIRRGFQANLERITNCYERVTQYGGPRIEGTVSLQLLLGVDGKVASISSATQLPPDITGCIEDVIAAWQFDEQDSPTIVNYPLTFTRAD